MAHARLVYHIVFCTYKRQPFIVPAFEKELYALVRCTLMEQGAKFCYLNGVEDHIHILVDFDDINVSLRDVITLLKQRSLSFMKSREPGFLWQHGYSVVSVNPYDYKRLLAYIRDQKQRHARRMLWPEHEYV